MRKVYKFELKREITDSTKRLFKSKRTMKDTVHLIKS